MKPNPQLNIEMDGSLMTKHRLTFLASLSVVAMMLAGVLAPITSTAAEPISQRIVRYTADDGVKLDAVLMHPEKGMNIGAPVIVMHHGGPSGHAARSIGAYRFAAERFAAAGYTTLSPVSRHSSGYYKYELEDSVIDIEASLEFVESLGFVRVILMGHSMGSLRITRYQVTHNNPIIKAMVHFAPTADTYDFVGKNPRVAPIIEAALKAAAAEKGGLNLHPDSKDPDTSLEPPAMMATARGRLQTPDVLLSWWGPGHPNANSDFFPNLTVPQLLLAGTEDLPVPPGRMERLKELAVNSPRVDYIWYEGGDHYFTFHQDESAADVLSWLNELGLEPGRYVSTKLTDTALNVSFTVDGSRVPYPGVSYRAEGTDRTRSPLLVYVYGLGEQILEDPIHSLAVHMARRGYEGLAPQLRESGFRGSLTSTIDRAAEDLRDVINAHRQNGRPVVFVAYREGILWALEAAKAYGIEDIDGFVALSPPPHLPDFARNGLGQKRYKDIVKRSETLIAEDDTQSFIVEKYFRPAPAVAGSTDAFMMYPETFLDYYGPNSRADFEKYVQKEKAPLLILTSSDDSVLDEGTMRSLTRLVRTADKSMMVVDNADEMFTDHEDDVADLMEAWLSEQVTR